jgi:hypothetical protein
VPTYDVTDSFLRDWRKLNPADRAAFIAMRKQFVAALRRGGAFPKGLRVEGFKSVSGWYEIRWAADGRALFSYGTEVIPGEKHIIWHRVGSHDIYK